MWIIIDHRIALTTGRKDPGPEYYPQPIVRAAVAGEVAALNELEKV